MSKLAESRGNRCRLLAKSIGFTAAPEKKTDLGHFSAWGPKTCNSGRGSGSAFLHPRELAKRTANGRLGKSDGFSGTDTASLGSESFLVFYVFVGGLLCCFFFGGPFCNKNQKGRGDGGARDGRSPRAIDIERQFLIKLMWFGKLI